MSNEPVSDEVLDICQRIVAGRVDGGLGDIAAAVVSRVKETMVTFAWRFRLDGVDVGELEVTLDEWEQMEAQAGCHFSQLALTTTETRVLELRHIKAAASVLLSTRGNLPIDTALARVGQLAAPDLADLFAYEVRSAPFGSTALAAT